MNHKYRYIACGSAKLADKVCDFRLVSAKALSSDDPRESLVIRIQIPYDMELTKYSCDSYSTTTDERLLKDLHGTVLAKLNGRYVKVECKEGQSLIDIEKQLEENGYSITKQGYLDKEHRLKYIQEFNDRLDEIRDKAKEFKARLDENPAYADDLKYQDNEVLVEIIKQYLSEKTGRPIF